MRESQEMETPDRGNRWLAPMFVSAGDLRYSPPALVMGDADDPSLQLEFVLLRSADSLDPALWPGKSKQMQAVFSYWLRQDKALYFDDPPADSVDRLPMQLPDLHASYVIVAQNLERKQVIEIARIRLAPDASEGVAARLLVDPYKDIPAKLGQFEDGPLMGRICARCVIDLSAPEFAWLRNVRNEDSLWQLAVVVERDGARFGGQE